MTMTKNKTRLYAAIMAFTFVAPFLFPTYGTQLATLWLMIIVSLTWDMTGGQMGYNSLGNIFFYGTGMYVAALVTIGLTYDVGEYTSAAGGGIYEFTDLQYFGGKHSLLSKSVLTCLQPKTLSLMPPELMKNAG